MYLELYELALEELLEEAYQNIASTFFMDMEYFEESFFTYRQVQNSNFTASSSSETPNLEPYKNKINDSINSLVNNEEKFNTAAQNLTTTVGTINTYLDYFIDALSEFGVSKGFTKEESIEYVLKMALGTILLNLSSSKSPKELGDEVCSPGGSTIEGVKVLLDNDFYKLINDAANPSYNKNKKML